MGGGAIKTALALDGLVVLPRSVNEELIQYTEKSDIATDWNVLWIRYQPKFTESLILTKNLTTVDVVIQVEYCSH